MKVEERMLLSLTSFSEQHVKLFWPFHILNIRVTEKKEDKPSVNAHYFIFLAYLC